MQIVKIDNVEQLRNTVGTPGAVVNLTGYYTPDDGGGGVFYWDENSVAIDNGGTVFTTTVQGGWIRVFDDMINLKWFGAKGDGVTVSTVAIQNAFNQGKPVYIPIGTYVLSGTVNVLNNIVADKGAIIKLPSNYSGDVFKISNKTNLSIKNLYIDATITVNPVSGLRIEGLKHSLIENFTFRTHEDATSTIGIDILTSLESALSFGVREVTIVNPWIENGQVGIKTQKQIGDDKTIIGLNVLGGRIEGVLTYHVELQECNDFFIQNVGFFSVQGVGYKFYNSHKGTIHLGDFWTSSAGDIAEVDVASDFIHFETPFNLDLPALITGTNYSFKTGNRIRQRASSDYYLELNSNNSAINSFELKGDFGGSVQTLLSYDEDAGLKLKRLSTDNFIGSTLIGLNTLGGLVNISNAKFSEGLDAPSSGTWTLGDFRKNTNPSSGGFFGWVCTASGSPGTWKGFGTIAP